MASFQFWWSEKVYFPSVFKRKFHWVWSWRWSAFFLTVKLLHHCHLAWIVSSKKSALTLLFSVHNLSFHSTFIGFQQFDYDMAWRSFLYLLGIQWDSLFFSPCLEIHWDFWFCRFILFIKFRKILVIISSVIFFCPLSFFSPVIPIIHVLTLSPGQWSSVYIFLPVILFYVFNSG